MVLLETVFEFGAQLDPEELTVEIAPTAGVVHPLGIVRLTCEPALKFLPFWAVKVNTKLGELPGDTVLGETDINPSPSAAFPSLNVVCASRPLVCPIAVSSNLASKSVGVGA